MLDTSVLCMGVMSLCDHKLRGMEIVGAPVGAPDFCTAFVAKTLKRMLNQSESLADLYPLLKDYVCAAPAYLAQVCHSSITKEHLLHFDDCVSASRLPNRSLDVVKTSRKYSSASVSLPCF